MTLSPDPQSRQFRQLGNTVRRLLKKHNADDIFWELNRAIAERDRPRKAGRPKFFDDQTAMAIWIFVQAGVRHYNCSVNEFCRRSCFTWLQGGGGKGAVPLKAIEGATLRRRYNEAERFLRLDSEIWWFLEQGRLRGRGDPIVRTLSPLERWWHRDLKAYMESEKLGGMPT